MTGPLLAALGIAVVIWLPLIIVASCGGGDGHCSAPEAACEAEEDKEAR